MKNTFGITLFYRSILPIVRTRLYLTRTLALSFIEALDEIVRFAPRQIVGSIGEIISCALVIGDDCIIKPLLRDNDWTLTLASIGQSKTYSLDKRHRANQESDISA